MGGGGGGGGVKKINKNNWLRVKRAEEGRTQVSLCICSNESDYITCKLCMGI